ncbi:hypothetical protein C8F01DRAFT_1088482 [Mycena amicta]|nr:hypothetical protein C8F01DRAFT_1088482 [Mycena amicta]
MAAAEEFRNARSVDATDAHHISGGMRRVWHRAYESDVPLEFGDTLLSKTFPSYRTREDEETAAGGRGLQLAMADHDEGDEERAERTAPRATLCYDSTARNERIPCAGGSRRGTRKDDNAHVGAGSTSSVQGYAGDPALPSLFGTRRSSPETCRKRAASSAPASKTGVEATGVEEGCITPGGGEEVQRSREKTVSRNASGPAQDGGEMNDHAPLRPNASLESYPSVNSSLPLLLPGIIRSEMRGGSRLEGEAHKRRAGGSSRRCMSDCMKVRWRRRTNRHGNAPVARRLLGDVVREEREREIASAGSAYAQNWQRTISDGRIGLVACVPISTLFRARGVSAGDGALLGWGGLGPGKEDKTRRMW